MYNYCFVNLLFNRIIEINIQGSMYSCWILFCPKLKEGEYGVEHHFQQYFSYLMAVSFIGGGNWSSQRKADLQVTEKLDHFTMN